MKAHFSKRLLLVLLVLGFAAPWLSSFAGESDEKLTGLPMPAGLELQQEVNAAICAKKAQVNLYDVPNTPTLTEYIAWYKDHLKNFHYVHKVWEERAQEMFYSPDGLTGASITGNRGGPGVYNVAYIKLAERLTTHQMDAFSPDNPSCK